MRTSKPTVRDLFNSPIAYQIPIYQRTYVWNIEDQWEPLWLDIIDIADPLPNSGGQYNPASRKPHFLGATVLKEMSVGVEDAKRYAVVDGQQRLTTIQLLLTAVADTFRDYKELESLEGLARDLTINWVRGAISTSEPDKIHPLAGDFRSFTKMMKASREDGQLSDVSGPIGDCYQFFRRIATQWLEDGEDSGIPVKKRAHALLTAICDKLQVVAIYLDADENESAIFEALNARGEPLSEWEKVKNYILFKAGEIPEVDQGELYDNYLLAFDDRQWLEETGRGAARRRMSDLFLDYWLESRLLRSVNARRVFREFRAELDRQASLTDLEARCAELVEDGRYFLRWQTTQEWDGDLETIFHSRRRAIGIGAIWPLLLALSRITIAPEDMMRCIGALDSFLWRRAIVGRQARSYDEIALELIKVLPHEPTGKMPFSNAIIEQLEKYERVRSYWPNDHEVRQAVLERKMPGWTIRQVLEAVERGMMRGKRPGRKILSSRLPIEHIMPRRRDEEEWPFPTDFDEEARAERDEVIHRLGNLTLVDHGLNSKLSNRAWIEKRCILHDEDNLYINKELLNHAPSNQWDEDQIRLRGERLADYIVKIWPRGHDVTGEIELLKL